MSSKYPNNSFESFSGSASVGVIVAAYNEQSCIKERIDNLLSLNFAAHQLTIYVGSDGSTDDTNSILQNYIHPQVKTFIFSENQGKASTLNKLVKETKEEFLVFTDANTEFANDAIEQLLAPFNDQKVGAVSGELELYNPNNNANQDNIYWHYEQFLKRKENKINAILGANGAIYAIRRSLYEAIKPTTIIDDFVIVMNIAKKKFKVIYNHAARAREPIADNIAMESVRRIRIGAGNYQAIKDTAWCLNPMRGWRCFSFISHKILRWFTPHCLVIAFVSSAMLSIDAQLYLALWLLQLSVYGLSFYALSSNTKLPKLFNFIAFFVAMNWALLRGFWMFLSVDLKGSWQRTER